MWFLFCVTSFRHRILGVFLAQCGEHDTSSDPRAPAHWTEPMEDDVGGKCAFVQAAPCSAQLELTTKKKKRAPFVFCSVWSTRKRKPLFLSPYVSTRGWHTKETQVLGLISPLAAIKTNPETGTKTNFSGGVLPLLAIVYHGGIIPHS